MYEVHHVDIVIVDGCEETEPCDDGSGDAASLCEDLLRCVNLPSVLYPVVIHEEVETQHQVVFGIKLCGAAIGRNHFVF